jgi:ribosomal protein S18 acetylase RimI-like enzyme
VLQDAPNHPQLNLPADSALIGLFAVDPEVQSKGIGRTLFNAALDLIKQKWSCQRAIMFVINKRLDIQAWYERLGFKWNGDRREFTYPGKTLQDDIWFKVYEKDLAA